jgi:hypothetical protein
MIGCGIVIKNWGLDLSLVADMERNKIFWTGDEIEFVV